MGKKYRLIMAEERRLGAVNTQHKHRYIRVPLGVGFKYEAVRVVVPDAILPLSLSL